MGILDYEANLLLTRSHWIAKRGLKIERSKLSEIWIVRPSPAPSVARLTSALNEGGRPLRASDTSTEATGKWLQGSIPHGTVDTLAS
jgi:hypothetical protein